MKNYFNSPFKGKELRKQVTNPNISVGRYSYYSGYYHYHNFEECVRYLSHDRTDVDHLKIGSFCSIGSGASFIMAGNQGHRSDWISTFPFHYFSEFSGKSKDGYTRAGDTVIKNDVWIGSEAIIMPGIIIENGAIIGSRTVVTKSIPAYSVVAGNPGRLIKMRFSDHDIMLLQKISWWNWPLCHIKAVLPILCSQNIHDLYVYWQNHYREL